MTDPDDVYDIPKFLPYSTYSSFGPKNHGHSPCSSDDNRSSVPSSTDAIVSSSDSSLPIVASDSEDSNANAEKEVCDSNTDIVQQGPKSESASDSSTYVSGSDATSARLSVATDDPYDDPEAAAENAALMLRQREASKLSLTWPPGYTPVLWTMMARDRLKGASVLTEELKPEQQSMLQGYLTEAAAEKVKERGSIASIALNAETLSLFNKRKAILRQARTAQIRELTAQDQAVVKQIEDEKKKEYRRQGPRFFPSILKGDV